jgi:hypothetical protein
LCPVTTSWFTGSSCKITHILLTWALCMGEWACSWFLARRFFYPEDGGEWSSETSVHTKTTRRHVPENGIFHSHRQKTSNLLCFTSSLIINVWGLRFLPCWLWRLLCFKTSCLVVWLIFSDASEDCDGFISLKKQGGISSETSIISTGKHDCKHFFKFCPHRAWVCRRLRTNVSGTNGHIASRNFYRWWSCAQRNQWEWRRGSSS